MQVVGGTGPQPFDQGRLTASLVPDSRFVALDSRNHILWNPTERSLRNVEVDEACKLAAFRERFCALEDGRATERVIEALWPAGGSDQRTRSTRRSSQTG